MNSVLIGGKIYSYEMLIRDRCTTDDATVHIVQPSHNSIELTRLSVECIKMFTEQPSVIWVVDNFSDARTRKMLTEINGVNLIFNRTKIGTFWRPWYRMPYGGSIANGVALELAAQNIDAKYMFVMHNDCVPVGYDWLEYLISKMNNKIKISGFFQDKIRVHAVHSAGFVFDFGLFEKFGLSFVHNMPVYDVCDGITIGLRERGYDSFVCKNTFNNPECAALFNDPKYPQFLKDRAVDEHPVSRCLNDNNELIYLHLGRGTEMFRNLFLKHKRLEVSDWVRLVSKHFLE